MLLSNMTGLAAGDTGAGDKRVSPVIILLSVSGLCFVAYPYIVYLLSGKANGLCSDYK